MPSHTPHDTGYKLLFSHPEMVRDLLTGYMPGEWLKEADFTSLNRVNASYVSEKEHQRHDDMVWRLKVGQQWVWVYLLLEFQSKPDPWMALRIMVYLGLLSQHLVNEGELQNGLLPPIVPIVLYNGTPQWPHPQDVADCFGPSLPGLEHFRPRLRYHLVDEARLKLHPIAEVRNLAEALFKVEQSGTLKNTLDIMQTLDALLGEPQMQPLRRTISTWLKLLLRRKVPQANIHELDAIDDILKESSMLEQTIERWFEDATMKGVRQGRQEGRQEGEQKGFARAVTLQLQLRFGPVPEWAQERLSSASEEQLTHWLGAILTAQSIDDLFGADGPVH
ncbi:MAG: Rpn family recombination-promoting nuclease/putative transposase [Burkholderiales bacterium]|nr:Rpn family recombination-promoting nuclease/putative transposase [Burkholderiales bacterium]MBK9346772.1 Rpn family recombination-promoting nuclease/putative transposase [Burkholderiales bacterium]